MSLCKLTNISSSIMYNKNILFSNNGTSLTGWTNSGGFSVGTVGSQTCLTSSTSNAYIYISTGISSFKGRTIKFNAYITGGCPDFFFGCNSSGAGQFFRMETRSAVAEGFSSTTSWTSWANVNPANPAYSWTLNQWLNITISITSGGVANFSVNGVAASSSYNYTISDNGSYIGIQVDGAGGSISINNIVIY